VGLRGVIASVVWAVEGAALSAGLSVVMREYALAGPLGGSSVLSVRARTMVHTMLGYDLPPPKAPSTMAEEDRTASEYDLPPPTELGEHCERVAEEERTTTTHQDDHVAAPRERVDEEARTTQQDDVVAAASEQLVDGNTGK